MSNKRKHLYEFGEYTLNTRERNLWRNSEFVKMPPKVFDTLCLLVERHDEVLSKEEMLDTIWHDSFVEENNLSQNISALRRIFENGNEFIETVPKRGFRFVAPVKRIAEQAAEHKETGTIVATQTKTRIVEEAIYENAQVLPSKKSGYSGTTKLFGAAFGLILLLGFGFIGFSFFSSRNDRDVYRKPPAFRVKSMTDTRDVTFPMVSPEGDFIAYIKGSQEKRALRLKDIESGNDVELEITSDVKPGPLQFSPDGKSIYFRTHGRPRSPQAVYRISRFGGEPKLVASNVWGYFAVSPSGKTLLYYRIVARRNVQHLIEKNLDTEKETVLLELKQPENFTVYSRPAPSPDGKTILVVPKSESPVRSEILALDVDKKAQQTIKTKLSGVFCPVWLPGGIEFFILAREKSKGNQIWRVNRKTGESRRITNDLVSYEYLSISKNGEKLVAKTEDSSTHVWLIPDGKLDRAKAVTTGDFGNHGRLDVRFGDNSKLIYDSRGEMSRDLWVEDLENGSKRRIVDSKDKFNHFATPGEKDYIYFSSDRTGSMKTWRTNLDGTDHEQISFGQNDRHLWPAVSPDEKWVYYVRQFEGMVSIWRKPLNGGKAEKFFGNRPKSLGGFLAISPNGKSIAFAEYDSVPAKEFGKVAILNIQTKKVFVIPWPKNYLRWTNYIRWSEGGTSVDYIRNEKESGSIWRQSVENISRPASRVFHLPKENLYNFDWSPDEKNLAITRGKTGGNVAMFELSGD